MIVRATVIPEVAFTSVVIEISARLENTIKPNPGLQLIKLASRYIISGRSKISSAPRRWYVSISLIEKALFSNHALNIPPDNSY